MSDLAQACSDLAAWYPHALTLTTQPDTDPTTTRHQPASRPPWNSRAADAALDIHAAARTIEATLRCQVTGTRLERGGSDANTLAALAAIPRLMGAVPVTHDPYRYDANGKPEPCRCQHCETRRRLEQILSAVLALPAVDLEQPPQALPAPCPRPGCARPMLRYYPARRQLACLGCMVTADVWDGLASGQPVLKWADGLVT